MSKIYYQDENLYIRKMVEELGIGNLIILKDRMIQEITKELKNLKNLRNLRNLKKKNQKLL